jgi:hypothetical protein
MPDRDDGMLWDVQIKMALEERGFRPWEAVRWWSTSSELLGGRTPDEVFEEVDFELLLEVAKADAPPVTD